MACTLEFGGKGSLVLASLNALCPLYLAGCVENTILSLSI
jgi:hypothetical protein